MNHDLEMFLKIILDLSLKIGLITPELFALKYDIPNELYREMHNLMYLSLAHNDGYIKTYRILRDVWKDESFDLTKYNEFLNAFKTDLELQDACDGILYKNICDWIDDQE